MTTFLDLPVECRLMVQEFYEADRRSIFDKVLKELLRRTRETENPLDKRRSNVRLGFHGHFEISYINGAYHTFYLRNSPRRIWCNMDGEARSIFTRKIYWFHLKTNPLGWRNFSK